MAKPGLLQRPGRDTYLRNQLSDAERDYKLAYDKLGEDNLTNEGRNGGARQTSQKEEGTHLGDDLT